MSDNKVFGVLLSDTAYREIGEALAPYVSEGPIGKYIYCKSAQQNGSFLDMVFSPAMYKASAKGDMRISIPISFVTFIASSKDVRSIGFVSQEEILGTDGQSE